MKKRKFLGFLFFLGIILAGFAIAGQVVLTSSGGTSFTINDDASSLLNISVNNTDGNYENITAVVITLPKGVNFTEGTNMTTGNSTFTNVGNTTLNWTNMNGLIFNNTLEYFSFSAVPSSPGKDLDISVTVYTTNTSVNVSQTNITLNINDTFTAEFNGDLSENYYNTTSIDIANVSFSGNETSVGLSLVLFNSSGVLMSNSSLQSPFVVNYSGVAVSDGRYYINLTVNNSQSDSNFSQRVFTLDTVDPEITDVDDEETTQTKINLTITASDSGTGVKECEAENVQDEDDIDLTLISGNDWELYDTGLDCGEDYEYEITCTDYAGNDNPVFTTDEFSTDACDSSSGGGGGGGGGGSSTTSSFWTNTFVDDSQDFEDLGEIERSLGKKQRSRIKIDGDTHYVGVIELTSSQATVNISSDPQQVVLDIGEEAKIDVDEDNYYDVKILLEGISSNKANLIMTHLHESYVPTEEPEINSNLTQTGNETITGETGEAKSAAGTVLVAILIILILGGILAVVIYYFFKNGNPFKKTTGETNKKE